MRRNNKLFIIGLLASVLILSGAYALFATTLNIGGTAGGATEFKIEFTDYDVSDSEIVEVDLNSANTTMNITADLVYPGHSATINFTIKNTGRLNARVNDIVINENSTDDFNISVVGLEDIKDTILSPNDTTEGSIVVTWNTASTNQTPESVNFSVTIDYVQAT
ncbi:MAG: hypothetical protein GX265_05880 [Mollicutes bacterium]|nr:hypothetical protein [Mollicutes bacterium]